MVSYLRNPLTYVWVFLTTITIVSWALSRLAPALHEVDAAITSALLLIAAVKARFVVRYFMEVRFAPPWLRRVTDSWIIVLVVLMLGMYWVV
jgi:hypothetical protein